MSLFNFWQLLAGLSLFLYGMFHLEDAMKQLQGRSFKLFLKKHTSNKLSAVFSGTLVTGVLQSSSIVNLMVLSFVGAGILNMRNALGVVLGANIGGTFNSWLVALLGFKMNLGEATLPIIGIAGIGLVFFKNQKKYYNICKFILGFGFLFMGLDFMKISMDGVLANFDFKPYLKYHKIVFVLIGFIITAIIQTSAATIVIVLSALNAKVIPIETAVAVILGAELGTTVKIAIGSIGGIAAKKRVALGNTFFNLVSSTLGFIFLSSIVDLLQYIIGDKDPLFVLVAFQTFINIGGAILFYFFLNKLGDYLDNSFKGNETHATLYLQNASIETPDAAILMIEKEVNAFVERVIFMEEEIFSMQEIKGKKYFEEKTIALFKLNMTLPEKYELLKKTEGEILLFYNKLLSENIETAALNRINSLLNSIRGAMYAAKGFKDVIHNVAEFNNSSNELKYKRFKVLQIELDKFNSSLKDILCETDITKVSDNLHQLLSQVELYYKQDILRAYQTVNIGVQNELEISTMFNFNHEVFSSCKSLIFSIKDLLLSETEAAKFENLYTQ